MFALNKWSPLNVYSSQSKFDCGEWGGWGGVGRGQRWGGGLVIPVNTRERETFAVTWIKQR